eukprot:gene5624-6809_t
MTVKHLYMYTGKGPARAIVSITEKNDDGSDEDNIVNEIENYQNLRVAIPYDAYAHMSRMALHY